MPDSPHLLKAGNGQPREVADIRIEIDGLDAEIVRLLSRRAECAIEVGTIKGRSNKPFLHPSASKASLRRLRRRTRVR